MTEFDAYSHLNLRHNPDGTIERLLHFPPAQTNADPNSGESVLSKDIIVNEEKDLKIRLYLPLKHISKERRIPIMFYFYGCHWVQFSADNPALHKDRQWTASSLPALIILVFYRLAPDCRLPGQYEDAGDAIMWLKKQYSDPDGNEWIKDYGDPGKCFLAGSNNGGNIAFNTALRLMGSDLTPLKFLGLILNQPLFGGKQRTKSEIRYATDQIIPLPALDLVWDLVLPKGIDKDHRYCNPVIEGPHQDKVSMLPPCLILGYGMDPLIDRYHMIVEMMINHGVKVEAHFSDVGFHRIEIIDSNRRVEMLTLIKMFIKSKLLDQIRAAKSRDKDASTSLRDGICKVDIVDHDKDESILARDEIGKTGNAGNDHDAPITPRDEIGKSGNTDHDQDQDASISTHDQIGKNDHVDDDHDQNQDQVKPN
ncbi:alpha/beta-Hydrolases superfamily protein [Euphorbia peplus]|nr:alpha/beta-Hydrolases superfamily protein [Euphorbia peplus]